MHNKILAFVLCLLTFTALPALARQTVPIVNIDNTPVVTAENKKLDSAQVLQAIKAAVISQNWTVSNVADGVVTATILVRQKHTVVVDIIYDADKYSIHYKDSVNMKYEKTSGGTENIHPFYNKWTAALSDAIRLEISKL
jgi:hypothetical protein